MLVRRLDESRFRIGSFARLADDRGERIRTRCEGADANHDRAGHADDDPAVAWLLALTSKHPRTPGC